MEELGLRYIDYCVTPSQEMVSSRMSVCDPGADGVLYLTGCLQMIEGKIRGWIARTSFECESVLARWMISDQGVL